MISTHWLLRPPYSSDRANKLLKKQNHSPRNFYPFVFSKIFFNNFLSRSGKTFYIARQLKDWASQGKRFTTIHLYYECDQPVYQDIEKSTDNLILHKGLSDFELSEDFEDSSCIILDDLQTRLSRKEALVWLERLFSIFSHHKNLTIFLVFQNLFGSQGSSFNFVLRNCSYIVLFNSPQISSTLIQLQKSIFPYLPQLLIRAAKEFFDRKYRYFIIDSTTSTRYCLKSGVLENEEPFIIQLQNE